MPLSFHPLADLFPLMEGAEFDALVTDIKEHGQREAIVLHESMILDGRNRYRACLAASVQPRTEEWEQDGTPHAFVVSKNLHRRHLNESQRAMIAAKLATLHVGHVATQMGNCGEGNPTPLTGQQAAELLNVHRDTVVKAKLVHGRGTPEEIKAVESGMAAVSTIAKQIRAKMPPVKRAKKNAEPQSQVGKNPERIQKQQINAEIWGRVRDALTNLTSLPLPVDAVAIARTNDRTGLVDARLAKSIQWLTEFSNAWHGRD